MKIFFRILTVPFITACIVTISIITFYYLDAPEGESLSILPSAKDGSGKSLTSSENLTSKESNQDPQIPVSRRDFVYPSEGVRDPFQQVSVQPSISPAKEPTVMLAGIIWDEENPIAIITDSAENSHIVRIGEKLSRIEILDIQPGSITIKRDDKTQELEL